MPETKIVEITPNEKAKSEWAIVWCFGSLGFGTNAHFKALVKGELEVDDEVPMDINKFSKVPSKLLDSNYLNSKQKIKINIRWGNQNLGCFASFFGTFCKKVLFACHSVN